MSLHTIGRRAALITGASAAAGILALTAAGAASAATAGVTPQPAGAPTVLYTPPPTTYTPPPATHHHHDPVKECFYSLETETDVIAVPGQADYRAPYGTPTEQPGQYGPADPAYLPNGHRPETETVKVVQLVRVCVTGEHVTVTDVGEPYGWVAPAPTPTGQPPITDRYVTAA